MFDATGGAEKTLNYQVARQRHANAMRIQQLDRNGAAARFAFLMPSAESQSHGCGVTVRQPTSPLVCLPPP
jgi:hypothetical protein